jgi:hypothetical protein
MDAELRVHKGAVTFFVDGYAVGFTSFKSSEHRDDDLVLETIERTVKDMSDRGVRLFFVPVYFDWPGDGVYDFSVVDRRVRAVFEAAGEGAYVIIRVQAKVMAPQWWMDANPEGVCKCGYDSDEGMARVRYSTHKCPSLGSDFWETAGLGALEAMARHVKGQDYGERVVGYLPTAYNSNEWFFRSYHDIRVFDFCPAMQNAFGEYMRERTGTEREFKVPGRIERSYGDVGDFYHPDSMESVSPVVEYYRFMNGLCAEKIVSITKVLREVHDDRKIIVGTFYGYSQGLANFYWLADSGHLALGRLMEDDGPDFTCSPLEYFTRNFRDKRAGGFCWSQSCAVDSGLVHGKGYFGEDDLVPPGQRPVEWTCTRDFGEDVEMLKRNFVFTLCKGQLMWWYDLFGHWYDSQERLDTVENCVRIEHEAIGSERGQVSEVAVLTDEQASWYLTLDRQFQRSVFWENFYYTFSKCGTTVDLLLLSDIEKADMGKYKAVFLPTCFAMNNRHREVIESLKCNGRSIVFYQADGFINPDNRGVSVMSDENMRELTGINIRSTESLFQLRITTDGKHELMKGCGDVCFGVDMEKRLNFCVEDDEAEALGYYAGRGPVGFAVKRFGDWSGFYCGVPGMTYDVSRNILRDAGVHIYTESYDIVYANKSYVGIFVVDSGGRKEIKLPGRHKVRECFSRKIIAEEAVDSFVFDAEQYHTYLFKLGDG